MGRSFLAAAFFFTVAAYGQNPPFQCVANVGVPPIVRSEGINELIGDVNISCTGGTPTAIGLPIPQANITFFLNTQVTSLTLANGLNEAALTFGSTSNPVLCTTPKTGCTATAGASNNPSVFTGVVNRNFITWNGVPLDPPGTGTRTLQITNVRANATAVGSSGRRIISEVDVLFSQPGTPHMTIFPPPIPVQQGLISTIQLTGPGSGLIPFIQPGVQYSGIINMQEGFTGAWTPQNGHPNPLLPGSGIDDATRLGMTFTGPVGSQVILPVTVQSPFVFLNLSAASSGPFSPAFPNTTLNGDPAFQKRFDPFGGLDPGDGETTLYFYGQGSDNFDPVFPPQVRSFSTPFLISSSTAGGFQGFLIAQTSFQPTQGFLFISDAGAQNLLLSGYQNQILDAPIAAPAPHNVSPQRNTAPAAASSLPVVTTVGSASFNGHVAISGNALVSGFASQVGSSTASAASVPLPTSLGGISLRITDSAKTQLSPGLLFVSPTQVNYLLPTGLANGVAIVEVLNSSNLVVAAGAIDIIKVAPGIFSANSNGSGVAAAQAVLVAANSSQTMVNLYQLSGGKYVAAPIDLSPAGQTVYLTLYGTGFRSVSSLSGASCQVGSQTVPVQFAGVAAGYVGLDQLNIGPLPLALAGTGEVPIQCLFDGAPANQVTVAFK